MKKTLLILLLSVVLISCNDSKTDKSDPQVETSIEDQREADSILTYQGEFIFTPDAAVFKGNSYIYGVTVNDLAKDLAKRVNAVKTEDYDMVPVIVRGKVTHKPEGADGWDEILTITEIINVSDTPTKADVELKANKS